MLPGAYKVFTTIVREGSTTPSALAEKLMADKGLVSRAVRELEAKGLIERAPDPSDGRSIVLTPTDDGLARLAAARAPQEAAMLDALESWTVDDIRTLSRLLRALSSGSQP